ncbi:MAG: hypothetical protein HDQ98_07480 [Lachnospiraceae bacterium]|nr:hypothetical protein [Lachnospiraceae bacterium]
MKKCYFAYNWKDEKLDEFLRFLKKRIEAISNCEIEVIYDKESFTVSENFVEKEKMILESDSIIIFFSPLYKKTVETEIDENRGVYREYRHILKAKEQGVAAIIPTIIRGDEKNAITSDFRENIAAKFDVDTVYEGKRGISIKKEVKMDMEVLARKVVKETELANRQRDYEFDSREIAMERLFGKSNADNRLPHKCMYKTDAYESVLSQSRKYVIGRKGSGKTTFFELLEKSDAKKFSEKYKVLRPIQAENFKLDRLFEAINKYGSDLKTFPLSRRLELFWEIYIYLTAIYIVCMEDEYCMIEDERQKIFGRAGNLLKDRKLNVTRLDDNACQEGIFISAIETYEKYFVGIVNFSTADSYEAAMVANFKIDNVMEEYFGKNLYKKLAFAIMQCKKNILIALDGFDTASEDFRKETVNLVKSKKEFENNLGKKRLEFEILFFRSMFTCLRKIDQKNQGIMRKVSLCIIMPQDRIDQIKEEDRDFVKYNFATLSWDAIDLFEMLILRLEYVYGVQPTDDSNLNERFKFLLRKYFKMIPNEVDIKMKDNICQMDLFKYMLRLSFWRPRDIIDLFYELYSANKNSHKKLSSDTIKDILNTKAKELIDEEVYGEYQNVIINIKEIMECFRDEKIILSKNDVFTILNNQPFHTSSLRKFIYPIEKFEILYELGILGIKVPQNVQIHENLKNNLCFNYNEGMEPLEILKRENIVEKIQIVINPVFSKKLALVYNTDEILEDYSWRYLYENHARKSTIKRI